MKILIKSFATFFAVIAYYSCSDKDFIPVLNLSINSSHSHPCIPTGIIEIKGNFPIHTTFKINDGNFQSEPIFKNVEPKIHKISIHIKNDFEIINNIEVKPIEGGKLFNLVSDILNNNCSKCHSKFNPQAGIDFTHPCDILSHWERIKARAIESIPSPMPPTGTIDSIQIQILSHWIQLGHSYNL